jgi:hypothetical protein
MRRKPEILWIAGAVLLAAAGVWVYHRMTEKPVISIDYVSKLNEMRRPADYRIEDDGGDLYMQACMAFDRAYSPEIRRDSLSITWPSDMDPEELQEVTRWLKDNEDALKMADEALAKKYCYVQRHAKNGTMMMAVLIPELAGMKNLCYGLVWRGKVKASAGDVQGGLDDVLKAGQLGRVLSERPCFLVEGLVAIAVTGMSNRNALEIASRCNMSSQELARLAERIRGAEGPYQSLDTGLEGERLTFYDAVQRYFTDDGHGDGRLLASAMGQDSMFFGYYPNGTGFASNFGGDMARRFYTVQVAIGTEGRKATLARYDRIIDKTKEVDAELPWQLKANGESQWRWEAKEFAGNAFVAYLVPALEKVSTLRHRYMAGSEGAVAAIAVLRYKVENGILPQGWDDIVKGGYMSEVPTDQFSGKPLVYKTTDDGFTVYSVGEDGTDDGGDRKKDVVAWPANDRQR